MNEYPSRWSWEPFRARGRAVKRQTKAPMLPPSFSKHLRETILKVVDAGYGQVALHNAASNRFIKMSSEPRPSLELFLGKQVGFGLDSRASKGKGLNFSLAQHLIQHLAPPCNILLRPVNLLESRAQASCGNAGPCEFP